MPQRILIVEDEVPQRTALERALKRAGYESLAVGDLASARERLRADPPALVLLDLQLPDGHGVDLLREVRGLRAAPDVIVMTGMSDLSVAVAAMQAGAYDFLAKPFDAGLFVDVVSRCLRDREARAGASPSESDAGAGRSRLVGSTQEMLDVFKLMGMAATSRSPVLIRGASGTGKELVARSIHQHQMPDRPFVAINCAALPDGLLESELFGHERGAFTGAQSARKGSLELAADGTLLLDEIGDTSPSFQTKLLRVLQEREFTPLGSERPRPLRARVMAATHRSLEEMTDEGTFRSDLYFRLRVIEIRLPALAERQRDLPKVAAHLLATASSRLEKAVHHIPDHVMDAMLAHPWPGNVRELENALTRAVALARGPSITLDGLGLSGGQANDTGAPSPSDAADPFTTDGGVPESGHSEHAPEGDETLDAAIEAHVRGVLARAGGNKREAARRLGISPARLYRILSELG